MKSLTPAANEHGGVTNKLIAISTEGDHPAVSKRCG